MKDFHRRVIERMGELEIGQTDLAKLVGVKQPSINALINGEIDRPRFIVELAIALQTTTQWLLDGTGPKSIADKSSSTPYAPTRAEIISAITLASEKGKKPQEALDELALQKMHEWRKSKSGQDAMQTIEAAVRGIKGV